jgi:peptidoglycan/LPS O-acetylase OafA/YrhL
MVPRHTSHAIDVARGLAALGVIWGHSIYSIGRPIELNGAFWVWIFLPISGYLVAKGFEADRYGFTLRGYGRFLWNRGLRIVPLAELALVIGFFLELAGHAARTPAASAARQFVFANRHNDMSLDGPLWTVAAELQFYLVSIALTWLMVRRLPRLVAPALWIASVWAGSAALGALGDNSSQPRTLLGNLPFFTFGIMLAAMRVDASLRLPRFLTASAVVAVVVLAGYLNNRDAEHFWTFGYSSPLPYGGAALCALVIAVLVIVTRPWSEGGAMAGPFAWPAAALAWCGFYTYGIYVYHSLLLKLNTTVLHLAPGFLLLAILLLAVVIAPFSYRFFEAPLMRRKRTAPAEIGSVSA